MMVFTAAMCNVTKIGGDGVVVEVDEMKLGTVKYNRGHREEGAWVVNGIERTAQRRVFSVHVERRDAATLQRVILSHVQENQLFSLMAGEDIVG